MFTNRCGPGGRSPPSFLLVVLSLLWIGALGTIGTAKLINEKIDVETVFFGPAARSSYRIRIRNDGRGQFRSFHAVLPPHIQTTSRLSAAMRPTGSAKKDTPLSVQFADAETTAAVATKGGDVYVVEFLDPLKSQEAVELVLRVEVNDVVRPLADSLRHGERPFVSYTGDVHFFSPYVTESLTGSMTFPSERIEVLNSADVVGLDVDGKRLDFGPYANLEPFSTQAVTVRFEKTISLSHWGAALVKEELTVRNTGPKIDGHFSRLDQMHMDRSKIAVNYAKSLSVLLPKDARDVYYKDLIGNITTSHLRPPSKRGRHFEAVFRYPLMGGWKVYYEYGYVLPLSATLKRNGARFALRFSAQPATEEPIQVRHGVFTIILPEGAAREEIFLPDGSVRHVATEIIHPTLSYFGRKKVVLERTGAIADLSLPYPVTITYTHAATSLLVPALVLSSGLFLFFSVIIVVSHLNLRLDRDASKEDDELKLYVDIKQLLSLESELSKLYDGVTDSIKQYDTRDQTSSFKQSLANALDKMKSLERDLDVIVQEITKLKSDYSTRMTHLLAMHRLERESVQKLGNVAVQLVEGKITQKTAEQDADKINETFDACGQRIHVTVTNLASHI